jgi:hypothetical protein
VIKQKIRKDELQIEIDLLEKQLNQSEKNSHEILNRDKVIIFK